MALKRIIRGVVVGGLLVAIGFAGFELFYWFTHVYESDARIRTELTRISAQVNGKISKVLVEEGRRVSKGEDLFHLVDDDIRLGLDALRTDLALKQAERQRLNSEKRAFETELESRLETQTRKIEAFEREHAAILERLALLEKNLSRVEFLLEKNLASEEKFIAEKDKVLTLRREAVRANSNVAVARSEYEQLRATSGQMDVIVKKIEITDLEQSRIKDDIRLREIALAHRRIVAPIDGIIGRIHQYVGEYVEDGVTVMTLHDPDRFWLEAYVEENQMRHVRVGQDVLIELELYPFQDFFGKVERIGNVTVKEIGLDVGSTGNRFGSNVERVPVRIRLDEPPPNLTPGMRASINIRIYQRIRLW